MSIVCRVCGIKAKRDPRAWYCWTCNSRLNKAQAYSSVAVRAAIKSGRLPKITKDTKCAHCDSPAAYYDHRDYSRPLDVSPVCRVCNRKLGAGKLPAVA